MLEISEKCIGCGGCAAVCPSYSIEVRGKKAVQLTEECILCGHCESICPVDAIYNKKLRHDDILRLDSYPPVSPELAEQFLRSRRSTRHWLDKPVSRDETEKLLKIGRYAQTGSNSQGVSYIVVETREKMDQLRELTIEFFRTGTKKYHQYMYDLLTQPGRPGEDRLFRNAPMMIIACGDKPWMTTPGYETSPQYATTYIELYAPTLGLGTCYCGYFQGYLRSGDEKLHAFLGVREDQVPHNALLFGYPKHKSWRSAPARNPAGVTFVG